MLRESSPTVASPAEATGATSRRRSQSYRREAWVRFRRNRLALAALVYVALLCGVALAAPLLAPHNPIRSDVRAAGAFRKAAWQEDANPQRAGDWSYPLGTDSIGRDVFSRLLYGTRVSLLVGVSTVAGTLLIGVTIGLLAGYGGRTLDGLLMRLTDVVYAFPALLLFIVLQVSYRDSWIGTVLNGLVLLVATLSVVSWTTVARLVRGEVLALREREFIEAARATGAGPGRVVLRHILPNAQGPIIVTGAYIIPGAIIAEAILSYLGIGVRPSVALDAPFPTSWGAMILDGSKTWEAQPWMLIGPAAAIASITLAFTIIGDGLRDALDPGGRR